MNQYNNYFLPSVLRDWNILPAETKQLNIVSSFKYFLKKDNKPFQNITIMEKELLKYYIPDYEQAAALLI